MNDVQNLIEDHIKYKYKYIYSDNNENNNYIYLIHHWIEVTAFYTAYIEFLTNFSDNSCRTFEDYILSERFCVNYLRRLRLSHVCKSQMKKKFSSGEEFYCALTFTYDDVTNKIRIVTVYEPTGRLRGATIMVHSPRHYLRMYPTTPVTRIRRHVNIPSRGEYFQLSSTSPSTIGEMEQNFVTTSESVASNIPESRIFPLPDISTVFLRAAARAELRSCRAVNEWSRTRLCKSNRLYLDRIGLPTTVTTCVVQNLILLNALFNALLLNKTFLYKTLHSKQILKTYRHQILEFLFFELNSSKLYFGNGAALDSGGGSKISGNSRLKSGLSEGPGSDITSNVAADRVGRLLSDNGVTSQQFILTKAVVVVRGHLDANRDFLGKSDKIDYLISISLIYLDSRNFVQLMTNLQTSGDLYPVCEFHYFCPAPTSPASGLTSRIPDDQEATRMFTNVRTETLIVQGNKVTYKILGIAKGRVIELQIDPNGRIYMNSVINVINYHIVTQTQTVPPSH